jgi:hypothetical protein
LAIGERTRQTPRGTKRHETRKGRTAPLFTRRKSNDALLENAKTDRQTVGKDKKAESLVFARRKVEKTADSPKNAGIYRPFAVQAPSFSREKTRLRPTSHLNLISLGGE